MEARRPGLRITRVARGSLAILAFLVATGVARAQDVFASGYGTNQFESYGHAVAYGPDLNGDGFGEIAVGAFGNLGAKGSVLVVSGRDFSLIQQIDGSVAGDMLGSTVCWCGDVDGDGLEDLAVGVPTQSFAGKILIYSSASWTLIRTLTASGTGGPGISMVDAGDMNGDGIDDLLAGVQASPSYPWGSVRLFSGADGSVLRKWTGAKGDSFGAAVAAIGDANGDGITDFAIGAPTADSGSGQDHSGAVDLFSGSDGSHLWRRFGSYWYDYGWYGSKIYHGDDFGRHLERVGDVDGDGRADVAATALNTYKVHVLSGLDGSDLRVMTTAVAGSQIAAIGDLQGDGLPELLAATPGWLAIYSSRDGKSLWQSDDFSYLDYFIGLAGTGDVNGDGLPDFLVGNETDNTNATGAGRVDLRLASDLWLDVEPSHHPQIWMTLSMRANEGPTGNLAALVLTGLNGAPLFQFLTFANFDATGSALLAQAHVPTGFTGTVLDLRAFAIGASGHLIESSTERITLP